MHALALIPGTTHLRMVDRPEPRLSSPHDVKLRVLRVGICGTDREEAAGGRALAPDGYADLVIGHEMFGQVVEVGAEVSRVQPGDYAVFTVRRGCGLCLPCTMQRSDMCRSGRFLERGIWGLDGFQAEYVVDHQQYVVRVPAELEPVGVLIEPLSVVEKAIDEAARVQVSRLPDALAVPRWLAERRCLVTGLGPIGLLAALALRLRGADVWGLDIVDPDTPRPQWLSTIGGHYVDGRQVQATQVDEVLGPMDLVFEAAGVAGLAFNLLDALALNGVYVLTGISGEGRSIELPAADLMRQLVLGNQLVIGSVNAARDHFQMAVDDLALAQLRWPGHVASLITSRHPASDFAAVLHYHDAEEIKTVLEW